MTIRRITISVPDEVARRVKKAAGSASVSAWVTGLIEEHLEERELGVCGRSSTTPSDRGAKTCGVPTPCSARLTKQVGP